MRYKDLGDGIVLRDDGLQLRPSSTPEWQEYQDWLAAGNVIDPPDPIPPPPSKGEIIDAELAGNEALTGLIGVLADRLGNHRGHADGRDQDQARRLDACLHDIGDLS